MAMDYVDLVQQFQEGKIKALRFVMDSEYNHLYLEWCEERKVEPSDESANDFLDELDYDMFEHQTNVDNYGFFSL